VRYRTERRVFGICVGRDREIGWFGTKNTKYTSGDRSAFESKYFGKWFYYHIANYEAHTKYQKNTRHPKWDSHARSCVYGWQNSCWHKAHHSDTFSDICHQPRRCPPRNFTTPRYRRRCDDNTSLDVDIDTKYCSQWRSHIHHPRRKKETQEKTLVFVDIALNMNHSNLSSLCTTVKIIIHYDSSSRTRCPRWWRQ